MIRFFLLILAVLVFHDSSANAAERGSFRQELRTAITALEQTDNAPPLPQISILRVTSHGQIFSVNEKDQPNSSRIIPAPPITRSASLNDAEKQSLGCLAVGSAGLSIALFADGVNIINVIAGGLVAPTNQLVLYTSLVGVVFASFCAVGQALTPAALMFYERYFEQKTLPEAPIRTKFAPYRQSI